MTTNKKSPKRKYERELSDVSYIKGVKGIEGGEGIRPLNSEEVKWLKKFNNEFVGGNFESGTNNVHNDLIEKNADKVQELTEQINTLKASLKAHKKTYKDVANKDAYRDTKRSIIESIGLLEEELLKYDVKGAIWADRYSRRLDMYHHDVSLIGDVLDDKENDISEQDLFDLILANSSS